MALCGVDRPLVDLRDIEWIELLGSGDCQCAQVAVVDANLVEVNHGQFAELRFHAEAPEPSFPLACARMATRS
jgi:hypothetical protein